MKHQLQSAWGVSASGGLSFPLKRILTSPQQLLEGIRMPTRDTISRAPGHARWAERGAWGVGGA